MLITSTSSTGVSSASGVCGVSGSSGEQEGIINRRTEMINRLEKNFKNKIINEIFL
jgi:hypothetical protein